nr:hypothetical protein Itr_chr14CG27330 [Ipomoea trifida]
MPEIQAQEPVVRRGNFTGKRIMLEVQGFNELREATQFLKERAIEEIRRKVEVGEGSKVVVGEGNRGDSICVITSYPSPMARR